MAGWGEGRTAHPLLCIEQVGVRGEAVRDAQPLPQVVRRGRPCEEEKRLPRAGAAVACAAARRPVVLQEAAPAPATLSERILRASALCQGRDRRLSHLG